VVWAWSNTPEEIDAFWVMLNYELSSLQTFQCPNENDLNSPAVYFDGKRFSRKRIESYDCLNVSASTKVVNQLLLKKLSENIDPSQVLYLPVFVQAKDALIVGFSVIIIKNCLPCLDPAKSNIKSWVVEGEFTIDYDGISFKNDCLGALDIAADTMTGHVVVSDRLKDELSKHNFKGLYFSQGVDLWM
jgi:hypothetical protein